MAKKNQLSAKSAAVLSLIAEGHSYSQVVDGHPDISYMDIFAAAEEALRLNESPSDYHQRMAEIKKRNPRAYERWDAAEDEELSGMHKEGRSVKEIAEHLGRQPSAIQSRISKLDLAPPGEPRHDGG